MESDNPTANLPIGRNEEDEDLVLLRRLQRGDRFADLLSAPRASQGKFTCLHKPHQGKHRARAEACNTSPNSNSLQSSSSSFNVQRQHLTFDFKAFRRWFEGIRLAPAVPGRNWGDIACSHLPFLSFSLFTPFHSIVLVAVC